MMEDRLAKALAGTLIVALTGGIAVFAVMQSRHQLELIRGGHCRKIMEALYTPPPQAHSSCYGEGATRHCSTYYTQADPFMRSLWRCVDPDRPDLPTEFWRQTAEEETQGSQSQ